MPWCQLRVAWLVPISGQLRICCCSIGKRPHRLRHSSKPCLSPEPPQKVAVLVQQLAGAMMYAGFSHNKVDRFTDPRLMNYWVLPIHHETAFFDTTPPHTVVKNTSLWNLGNRCAIRRNKQPSQAAKHIISMLTCDWHRTCLLSERTCGWWGSVLLSLS